jgi:septal ring factor EnvC (AmiA/AmiB activator)
MDEEKEKELALCAERLSAAAEALDRVLERLEAQYKALDQKISRIVAAVDEEACGLAAAAAAKKAAPAPEGRKTQSPAALLAKDSGEAGRSGGTETWDRAMRTLSPEQRITVKSELARMGVLS